MNLNRSASRKVIVRTLPFSFDLDTALRRSMTEPEVGARQRAFSDFRQHLHANRGVLVGRCVRRGIPMAACQKIHWNLARVHRHVKLLTLNPAGHERAYAKLAMARGQLHPGSALDAAFVSKFR